MNKILKLTNGAFEEIEVANERVEYEELKSAVGGWIEHVTFNRRLAEAGIDVWVDEEGKLKELKDSCVVYDFRNHEYVEILSGPVVFTGKRKERFDDESYALTDEQIEIIKNVLCDYIKVDSNYTVRVMPYR